MLATIPAQPAFALWLMPHLALLAAPLLTAWVWRSGGRFSIKHVFLAVTAVAILGNHIAWTIKASLTHGPVSLIKYQAYRSWPTWLAVFAVSVAYSFLFELWRRRPTADDQGGSADDKKLPDPIE
jgi:hypothetical protein